MYIRRFPLPLLLALALAASGCDDPARPAPAAAVELAAEDSVLDVGDSLVVAAAVWDAQGRPLAGRAVAWSSSDTLVATVHAGVVKGRAPGRATITAAVGEVQGTLDLAAEPRVARIALHPANRTTLHVGMSARLQLFLYDAEGQEVQRSTHWSSSDPSVVVVGDSGVIRGVAPGTAVVTAAAGKTTQQIPVAVVRPYTVTSLETPPGGSTRVYDLNAAGEVVGTVTFSADSSLAVLWRNGRMTPLGAGAAYAINDRGQVAGGSGGAAVIWDGGEKREAYRRGTRAAATAINQNGDVAGDWWEYCACRNPLSGAFAVVGGKVVDVVPADGYKSPLVYGINDAGWVVGSLGNNRSQPDAFLYRDGEMVNLESTLFGVSSAAYSWATGVNNLGQVVGQGPSNEGWQGMQRAFRLENGKVTWLGDAQPPPSGANDVNDRGEVVGYVGSLGLPGARVFAPGFLWWAGGATRLDWLLVGDEWAIGEGVAVNERGQILAYGKNIRTGAEGPLLLTPPD